MNMSTWMGAATALLLLGGAAHAGQTNWQVTITDLPLLPGGTYASAYAINDTGKIVGMANDSTGAYKTVQWVNGQISVIPDLAANGGLCVPQDLNDAGESAGRQSISGFFSYAIYWDSQNNVSALPGLPSGLSALNTARAINASGQIVGMAKEGGPNYFGHAVVWFQGSLQSDLGFMGGGNYSEALGINDLGAVVGVASIASTNQHAFLWQNGQYTDLSNWPGGGASSKAFAINNQGDIVGLNASVASIWHNGSVQALSMPAGLSAFTPVIDINDAGDMIATASAGYPIEVGVLWRNGTAIDLGTLPGGLISRARRINAAGEIVGEAQSADGFYHAVKWTVTAASSALCFGDGSSGACPCGNNGSTGRGCQNSASTGGALLASTGVASLASDTLVLHTSGELPTALSILLQGNTTIAPASFGDGLRCTAGILKRLYTHNASGGAVSAPQAGELSISAKSAALGDVLTTGATRYYQTYYRDPVLGFCPNPAGDNWNVSSGVKVTWQ